MQCLEVEYHQDILINIGETEASALAGDATTETKNWHGSGDATWVTSSNPAFVRGYSGAFSYYSNAVGGSYYGRAVVVVGAGLLYG